MLYLENLSSESLADVQASKCKTRQISGGAPAVITEPDRIFEVVGKGRISSNEVSDNKKSRSSVGFVRPHWRRAHYKRAHGAPQNAPKTIRVPAVLVRADLVPLYGIVGGTSTVVIM